MENNRPIVRDRFINPDEVEEGDILREGIVREIEAHNGLSAFLFRLKKTLDEITSGCSIDWHESGLFFHP